MQLTSIRPPDAVLTYTERPVAVVSEPSASGFTQTVAYPSYPKGGRKVFYRGAASVEDALRSIAELRTHAPGQAFAVLDGSIGGAGSFVVTPLGTPRTSSARNIPGPGRHPSDKLLFDVTACAVVAPATAGLRAIVRGDDTVLRFPSVG